jgi:tetratricopeptide (TPR) repeat protein
VALPSELRTSLPSSIDADAVRAAVRASGSPGSLGGETWLLDIDGALAVLVRTSIFDPLEPLALVDAQPVTLREGKLEVRPAERPPFSARPASFELAAVAALLENVNRVATRSSPDEPAVPRREPTTLTDLDVIDPDLENEVVTALEAGEYERVIAAARELARHGRPRERDEWNDLLEIVALLRAGDHVAALLWTCGVRRIPSSVADALFGGLSDALERLDEPALAWAAAGQLLLDDSGPDRRARIEKRLGRDGPTLARELATRSRDFFSGPAERGDRLAQRGLASALMQLDELGAAIDWIRRAVAAERFDFDARMLETQILALRAIEIDDRRELTAALQKVADDFHDRPEPLVALADYVEPDDPEWAIESLRKAQAREFDEFVLLSLVDLLARRGRHDEVVREIEQAFADPDSIPHVIDQLRELAATRTKPHDAPLVPAQPKPTIVVVIAAALVIMLALAVLLLS